MVGYEALMRAVQRALPAGTLPDFAPAPRPAYVPGVDYFSGDLGQMLGLPRRVREDDVAPLAKVLGDAASRCARRIDKGEYPGLRVLRLRPAGPAARGDPARLDGDPADSAAVGELQPRRVRGAAASSTAR